MVNNLVEHVVKEFQASVHASESSGALRVPVQIHPYPDVGFPCFATDLGAAAPKGEWHLPWGKDRQHQIILFFGSNAALSAIMGGLLCYPLKDIRKNGGLSNTSLTILETKDGGKTFKPVVWNETSYLGRKLSKTDSL